MLTRRGALRILGAVSAGAFAGCSRTAGGRDPPPVTPAPIPTAEPDSGRAPDVALELTSEVIDQFDSSQPAALRIGVRNTDDVPIVLSAGSRLPFLSFSGRHTDEDAELVIVPRGGGIHLIAFDTTENVPPTEPSNGCWRLNGSVFIPAGVVRSELAPGDSIHQTYSVYAHRNNEACIPSGSYQFVERKPVKKLASGVGTDRRWTAVTLGFSLTVGSDLSVGVASGRFADAD